MVGQQMNSKDLEGSGSSLISESARSGWGKSWKTSLRAVSASAEIRTENLPKSVTGMPFQPVKFFLISIWDTYDQITWEAEFLAHNKHSLVQFILVYNPEDTKLTFSYARLHVSALRGHLQATHLDGTYCTVVAYVNSTRWCTSLLVSILVFWGLFFFSLRIAASLCPFVWPPPGRVYLVLIWCSLYKVHMTRGGTRNTKWVQCTHDQGRCKEHQISNLSLSKSLTA
jgi:hypothetical protein